MLKLTVRKEIRATFGASKWRKQDHDVPLVFRLSNAMARFYLEEEIRPTKSGIIVFPRVRLELVFDPAPSDVIRGLARKGSAGAPTAEYIYEAYLESHVRFEALLYSAGKVRDLIHSGGP